MRAIDWLTGEKKLTKFEEPDGMKEKKIKKKIKTKKKKKFKVSEDYSEHRSARRLRAEIGARRGEVRRARTLVNNAIIHSRVCRWNIGFGIGRTGVVPIAYCVDVKRWRRELARRRSARQPR